MLSLWQSGCYRLMDDDVPYPSAFPTAKGAPTPYKDEDGAVRSEGSGPQSRALATQPSAPTGGLRSDTVFARKPAKPTKPQEAPPTSPRYPPTP